MRLCLRGRWGGSWASASPPPGGGSSGCRRRASSAGRRLELDKEKLGFGVTVFLGVKLATKGRVSLEDFERAVSAIPEVQTVEHVLGMYDYRLRVTARDISDFERVLAAPGDDPAGGGQRGGQCAAERGAAARAFGLDLSSFATVLKV